MKKSQITILDGGGAIPDEALDTNLDVSDYRQLTVLFGGAVDGAVTDALACEVYPCSPTDGAGTGTGLLAFALPSTQTDLGGDPGSPAVCLVGVYDVSGFDRVLLSVWNDTADPSTGVSLYAYLSD